MTYKDALVLVRERATAKYGDTLAGRLNYLVKGLYEKGSRDITQKTADRKVETLTAKFYCSEKQLRRILETLEEIEVQKWQNRKIWYKFNPGPLKEFDLEQFTRESQAKDRKRLQSQAARMRERRAAESRRRKMQELLQLLRQHTRHGNRPMTVEELISTVEQNLTKGANEQQ
jgi:hypothetical protein